MSIAIGCGRCATENSTTNANQSRILLMRVPYASVAQLKPHTSGHTKHSNNVNYFFCMQTKWRSIFVEIENETIDWGRRQTKGEEKRTKRNEKCLWMPQRAAFRGCNYNYLTLKRRSLGRDTDEWASATMSLHSQRRHPNETEKESERAGERERKHKNQQINNNKK